MNEEQAYAVFSRLVLQNKIREAVRFITDRAENGGILQPDDDAGKGKSVKKFWKRNIQIKQFQILMFSCFVMFYRL